MMNKDNTHYSGPDRRLYQRRKIPDRRAMIRYEPEKVPRRCGNGRRQGEIEDLWDNRFR